MTDTDLKQPDVGPADTQSVTAGFTDIRRTGSKRSQHLRLVLMAATAPVALAGCDREPTGTVLSSVQQCETQQQVPVEQCTAAYEKALAEHRKLAPRFDSQVQCNEQFGSCEVVQTDRGQSYVPPMGGFLLGYALASTMGGGMYPYSVGGVSPLYRDYGSGRYLKPNGDAVSRGTGMVRGSRGNTALPSRAMTVSRSGFGSSASARGGFGSSRGFGG